MIKLGNHCNTLDSYLLTAECFASYIAAFTKYYTLIYDLFLTEKQYPAVTPWRDKFFCRYTKLTAVGRPTKQGKPCNFVKSHSMKFYCPTIAISDRAEDLLHLQVGGSGHMSSDVAQDLSTDYHYRSTTWPGSHRANSGCVLPVLAYYQYAPSPIQDLVSAGPIPHQVHSWSLEEGDAAPGEADCTPFRLFWA